MYNDRLYVMVSSPTNSNHQVSYHLFRVLINLHCILVANRSQVADRIPAHMEQPWLPSWDPQQPGRQEIEQSWKLPSGPSCRSCSRWIWVIFGRCITCSASIMIHLLLKFSPNDPYVCSYSGIGWNRVISSWLNAPGCLTLTSIHFFHLSIYTLSKPVVSRFEAFSNIPPPKKKKLSEEMCVSHIFSMCSRVPLALPESVS